MHPEAELTTTKINAGGPRATAILVETEEVRKLSTDFHISARLSMEDGMSHHLQIQAYRCGGNTLFFLSGWRIQVESLDAVIDAGKLTIIL